jgi:hypothetical protein
MISISKHETIHGSRGEKFTFVPALNGSDIWVESYLENFREN